MKKTIIVFALLLAIIPAMAFADFQIGVVAGDLATPIGDMKNSSGSSTGDLSYGLESRLKLWIFQVGVSAFYDPSYKTMSMFTDAGLALDLLFVRVGMGLGPTIAYDPQHSKSTSAGWNLKTALDINLWNLGLGIVLYSPMSSLSGLGNVMRNYLDNTYVGVTLMFKLF